MDREPIDREGGASFECRVWQGAAETVGERIVRWASAAGEGTDADVYLLLPGKPSTGIKVRDGRIEMKRRVEVIDGLERWKPVFAGVFPIAAAAVPGKGARLPGLGREDVASLEDLVEAIRARHPGATPIPVRKHRRHFDLDGCKAEVDHVEALGRELRTTALEHESAHVLLHAVRRLGAQGFWKAGYPEALLAVSEQGTGSEPCAGKSVACPA